MKNVLMVFLFFCSVSLFAQTQPLPVPDEIPFKPQGRPLQGLVITIDPGHGGLSHAEGYIGSARGVKSNVDEEYLNMLVAAELRHYLHDAGARVYMTRSDDRKVTPGASDRSTELGARVQKAVDGRSHLFLSLHHNASVRTTANGVMILAYPTDSTGNPQELETQFAEIMRYEVDKMLPHTEKFDLWIAKHPLVTYADIPSIGIEFGFLSNAEFDEWVNQPGVHRIEAQAAYNGVVRMWATHRKELEDFRKKYYGLTTIRNSEELEYFSRMSARQVENRHPDLPALAQSLWPFSTPPKTEKEVNWILNNYREKILTDRTLFYCRIVAQKDGKGWILNGAVNLPQLKETPEKMLNYLGIKLVKNNIRLLPDKDKLGGRIMGICPIPESLTWGEPREGANVQSQIWMGDRLHLLDISDDSTFYLVHGQDGYIGWVRYEGVLPLTMDEFKEWAFADRVVIKSDVLIDVLRIPAGSAHPIVSSSDSTVTIRLPRGFRSTQNQSQVTISKSLVNFLPTNGETGLKAAQSALEYRTVPYVYGGKSRFGVDCSGLTGTAYQSQGILMGRDARQQIISGQLVGTPWNMDYLKPGDLVYFIDDLGRVVHTGISIGGKRFLHASPPEVQVSSFDPKDPLYSPTWTNHFCFAKRPYLD